MRRAYTAILAAVALVVTGLGGGALSASATTGDIGYLDQAYNGSVNPPTSDKPQSKLWYAGGLWWADMFDTVSKTWHIFRLDRATEKWVDTGTLVDSRPNTLADTLWDGTHLYIASHVVTVSTDEAPKPSVASSPAYLYRYTYSSTAKKFTLDSGYPATITTQSSESMTIDKDSTGVVWATWTQVKGSSTTGYTSSVYVNASSAKNDKSWGTPFVLPVAGATVAPDDISGVVAFGKNKIGVLWSNQTDESVYWAVHNDGQATSSWKGSPAIRGNKQADDHLNIKALQADTAGRVFAAVKTSADLLPGATSDTPQILLLVFKPGTGSWSSTTFGTLADCHTRPQVLLDEQHSIVHVVATAPTSAGCSHSGAAGSIYDKSAPMDNPVFTPGRGTPIVRDAASENMNNVTTTKQGVNGASGMVVLASNDATKRYWHADLSLGAAAAPTASFTESVTSGAAPLAVTFTDTSSGSPTSWAWDFGDGSTSTSQNPTHTFTNPGTYTVSLTATNSTGTSAAVTQTVTATAPVPVTAGATSTAVSTTAVTDVTVSSPSGVTDGDVLIAQFTADNNPSASTVPAGWSSVLSARTIGTGAKLFAYYHVVSSAAAEPASYTWQLSAAQKWNAGIADFHGVDPTTPFDTAASGATAFGATTVTVPGVTTVTAGALVVGGVGVDSGTVTVTEPTGWTEALESTGAQVTEVADQSQPTAGATGDKTWTLSKALSSTGWLRALRPKG